MRNPAIPLNYVITMLLAGLVLSCGCARGPEGDGLTIAGSTTVQPIVTKAAEVYKKIHPGTDIGVQGGGSGTGIRMVGEGSVAIGASSRDLDEREREEHPNLQTHTVAIDCLAIVVHPSNPVSDLSMEQLRDIFAGRITNFKEVGGPDRPIVLVIREDGSGTRSTFESLVMDGKEAANTALQKPASGAIRFTVSGNRNAIGYLGIGYLDPELVKAVSLGGIAPTEDNIKKGDYPISRNLYLVTSGEPEGNVKEFLDFIYSEEGQEIVREEGFVSVG